MIKRFISTILTLGGFFAFLLATLVLNYIYLTGYISQGKQTDLYNISNSILLNIIAGYIFYFFLSYLPDQSKNKILRNNLKYSYMQFKKEILGIFLSINGDHWDRVDELMDLKKCREYLNENNKERYYNILNYLNYENENDFKRVLDEIRILKEELDYTLNNKAFTNEDVFVFIKNLSRLTYTLQNSDLEAEDFRRLSQFLFELFTGWDFSRGYSDIDIVEKMINSI